MHVDHCVFLETVDQYGNNKGEGTRGSIYLGAISNGSTLFTGQRRKDGMLQIHFHSLTTFLFKRICRLDACPTESNVNLCCIFF